MSRRDKLIERMRDTPGAIRFAEVAALLRYSGFKLVNRRGSHFTYRGESGMLIVVVRPHGHQKTCRPGDIRKVLGELGDDES